MKKLLASLLSASCLSFAGAADAAFVVTDNGTSAGTGGATATITTTSDSPIGSLELVFVAYTDYVSLANVVADNAATPNNYNLVAVCNGGGGNLWMGLYASVIATDLPVGGHITTTNVNFGNTHATLVTGNSAFTNVFDRFGCNVVPSSLTLTSPTVTPSLTGELVVGWAATKNGGTLTQSAGYSTPPAFTSNLDGSGASITGSLVDAGLTSETYSPVTTNNASGGGSLIATIKPLGSPPPRQSMILLNLP